MDVIDLRMGKHSYPKWKFVLTSIHMFINGLVCLPAWSPVAAKMM